MLLNAYYDQEATDRPTLEDLSTHFKDSMLPLANNTQSASQTPNAATNKRSAFFPPDHPNINPKRVKMNEEQAVEQLNTTLSERKS